MSEIPSPNLEQISMTGLDEIPSINLTFETELIDIDDANLDYFKGYVDPSELSSEEQLLIDLFDSGISREPFKNFGVVQKASLSNP